MLRGNFSRRDLLRVGALGVGSVVLPLARLGLSLANEISSPPITPFQMALPIPVDRASPGVVAERIGPLTLPLTPSGRTNVQADVFKLDVKVGHVQMLPPPFGPTRVWGYNGRAPGPTFLVQRDRPAFVVETNFLQLGEFQATELAFSTHLHGGNVDGLSDGHPLNLVQPGISKFYTYFNEQPAVTMWYHDHSMHHTSRNVYHGIAGFYLLSDAHEDGLNLPRNDQTLRQFFDIPLLIQDKIFSQDGSELIFPPGDQPNQAPGTGTLGDTIVVNGAAWPVLEVQRRKYRFRFLNGSVAREYRLALSSGQPFIQIATEGGLLPRPLPQQTIRIAQAERYEVVVDFRTSPDEVLLLNLFGEGKLGFVMKFKVLPGNPVDTSSVPDTLMASDLQARFDMLRGIGTRLLDSERSGASPPPEISRFRSFEFNRSGGFFTVNSNVFRGSFVTVIDPVTHLLTHLPSPTNVDDADPKEGAIEVWTFVNSSGGWFHPIHAHLLHAGFGFLMLDRNEQPITQTSQEFGWKETANLGFGNTIRVIMQWPTVPVNPNEPEDPFYSRRYAFHCHNTDHEDDDMMAQTRVDRA